MLRIRFVVLSIILLLCLPSCGKKRRDFASYPLQNPQGIDFEGDPDFVSAYMRYVGVAKDQKNVGESASIFELDSVEELEEFDPVDAGWEVEKIPPGKTEFEEFLTDNLDTLKSNVVDTFKQAKESFDAVVNVTKKSLPKQPDGRAKKRASKRAKSTFRSTTPQARSSKAKNNQSIPEIADTTKETETDDLIQDSTQENGVAFENTDPKSEQNARNIGEPPKASVVEPPEVNESKREESSADALQEEQTVTNKEENLDPNNRGDDRVKGKLDHDKLDHEIITNQESYGERASQQNTLKPDAITGAKDSLSSHTSTLNAKTENSSPTGFPHSESMDDEKSKTAKGIQHENSTPQTDSTLNAKTENSSPTGFPHSESMDDEKSKTAKGIQHENSTPQTDSTLNAKTENSSPTGFPHSESMDDEKSKTAKGIQHENSTPQTDSTLNAKTENSSPTGFPHSESMDDEKSKTAKGIQHENSTPQTDSTLNAKTENSSPTGFPHSESMDDEKSKTAKGIQHENSTPQTDSTLNAKTENVAQQQDDSVVGFCDCIPSCSCMHRNNTLAAEENASQRNDFAINPCDPSHCSKSDEAKEEIQESIPSTEGGGAAQVTTVRSGRADCSIGKGIGHTLKSSQALAKILPSLPFCKSECANTVIYSNDPIIENARDGQSDEEN
ncbi:hypothetical protein [Neorickettsia findlayensis]|uniref:Uncharacterized protein n=1 Tax=Neorickettsia findlayensis TaxID=2686014 RepID=A0A6P1GAE4_9RICK|nr:hypothetical protein [Neorickettsia findlayensis]QHD65288.1 hypothetical protein GP480_02400 [Neorickettsia findlayensis]